MNLFQIIANDISLDTYDDLNVSLNYILDDILDISKRNTNFSKTITLPGTSINNKFFKQIFDVNIDNINFNVNKKIPAIIRNGDSELMNGNLQLINITIVNGDIEYEVIVAGVLKNIMNDTADYTLRDLNFSEYNHFRTKSSIVNSWDHYTNFEVGGLQQEGPGFGYIYPYIINGRATDIDTTIYVYDLYPGVYNKTIWDKMFEFLGYTYTSNFINSEYFLKQFLPFTGDKLTKSAEQIENQAVRVGSNPVYPSPGTPSYVELTDSLLIGGGWWYNSVDASPAYAVPMGQEGGSVINNGDDYVFTDLENQVTDNCYYTCVNTGYYNVNVDFKVFPHYYQNTGSNYSYSSGSYEMRYYLQLVKNNGTVVNLDSSLTGNNGQYGVIQFAPSNSDTQNGSWIDYDTPLTISMSVDDLFIEAGDEIRIFFGANCPNDINWNSTLESNMRFWLVMEEVYDGTFSTFSVEAANNDTLGGELIDMNNVLPNTKLKDYFLDLVKMFNLVVVDNPNKPNDLIIEPRDDYYSSKKKVKDWTYLVDRDKGVKITPMSNLDAKEYLFKYKDDSDWLNKQYMDETGKSHGQYSLDVINDYSEKTTKTEIGFSSSPSADKYIDGRIAPFFVDGTEVAEFKPKKVNRRILFYGGKIAQSQGIQLRNDENDVSTEIYVYPYCGMWDHPTEPKWSLSFGDNDKEYFNFSRIPNSNLYQKFHKQTLVNITDVNARLFEAYFHLTSKDISEFDFRDIILIDGAYWRVTKISDFNTTGESVTKVLLYKIVDAVLNADFSLEIPTSNGKCPVDMVSVVPKGTKNPKPYYESISGQTVTEDCCTSLGGYFDNNVCYINVATTSGGSVPVTTESKNTRSSVSTSEPTGPVSNTKDGNTINSLGVKVYGKGNYVPKGVESAIIIGNNNSIEPFVKNALVVGDGITAIKSDVTYIGDVSIDGTTGEIANGGVVINDLQGVLAVGNTTGPNNIVMSAGTVITTPSFTSLIGINDTTDNFIVKLADGSYEANLDMIQFPEVLKADGSRYGTSLVTRRNTGGSSANYSGIFIGNTTITDVRSPILGTGLTGVIINSLSGNIGALSENTVILGGYNSVITGNDSVIIGGGSNDISGSLSFIGGGYNNEVTSNQAGIFAGINNDVNSLSSVILGGDGNLISISSNASAILGGINNTILHTASVILGGNSISTEKSLTAYVPDFAITKNHAIPANSASTVGSIGGITWDANYIYVKTAVGAWKRVALSTF